MYWLIGSHGTLGSAVLQLLEQGGEDFVATNSEVDIADREAVRDMAHSYPFEAILNCAAFTDVRACETEVEHALRVNADGVRNLVRTAEEIHARLVHVSTDYVFDGKARTPYHEDAPVNPLNVYGKSKLVGETYLRTARCPWTLVRTSWLYGETNHDFVGKVLARGREVGSLRVVNDQYGTPTFAGDLAEALLALAAATPGMYHFANEGTTSWFVFAQEIVRAAASMGYFETMPAVEPVSSREFDDIVVRPMFSALATDKVTAALGKRPRPWRQALQECLTMALALKKAAV
jgi:dTDP-4-dehydrorhamnose reductase